MLDFVLRKTSIKTDTCQCKCCSHFFITPTFDDDEIDRLYSQEAERQTKQQYRESEKASGLSWAEQNHIIPEQQQERLLVSLEERPRRLKEIVEKVNIAPNRICDVGGMNGQIMSHFHSSDKYVYDKHPKEVGQECKYLTSLQELALHAPFDMFIFSHVLEHVPEPLEFINLFRPFLSDRGYFYIAVPLQYQGSYLKRRGIQLGPHVNYFTMPSLRRLASEAGMPEAIFTSKEVVWYGELKSAALKLICQASPTHKSIGFIWPLELIQDIYFHYKAKRQ